MRSLRHQGAFLGIALLLFMGTGCRLRPLRVDNALLSHRNPHDLTNATNLYQVRSPDVLQIYVPERLRYTGRFAVRIDGRIRFRDGTTLAVEGKTLPEITQELAAHVEMPEDNLRVTVAEHNSQQIFVHGQVKGKPRAVAYHGPETILSFLQRLGGITPGATPRDVKIVRANVAHGKAPEVFEVDLEEVLQESSDVPLPRLEPFDQVYVGQSRKSIVNSAIPRWLRPLYSKIVGLTKPHRFKTAADAKPAPASGELTPPR